MLKGVDLEVEPGAILGLLGSNGAGKSTLISVATGLLHQTSGEARVLGFDMRRDRLKAAPHLGYAPQSLGVYPTLTSRQNLMIFAELAGLRGRVAKARVAEVLAKLDLEPQADRLTGELSGGQQRRVHTGMALVGNPKLLFLDEPTVGADLLSRRQILASVRELAAAGTAVVYTSHVLSEFAELGAEIAVLHEGVILERGGLDGLIQQYASASVELSFRGHAPALTGWQPVDASRIQRAGTFEPGLALAEALTALHAQGRSAEDLVDVRLRQPGLEEVFLALTGSELRSADPLGADPLGGTLTTAPPTTEGTRA